MQLTKHTDLSLRVMIYLALMDGETDTIKNIATSFNASHNHLIKVVHQLAKLGYLSSFQGRGGGIKLAHSAEELMVGDIIRKIEPTLNTIDCEGEKCPIRSVCRLKKILNEALIAFMNVMDDYSIADIASNRSELIKLIH